MEKMKDIYVLLVEDNPGDARLIREMLQSNLSAVYNITVTDTLREALELFGKKEFNIVLLDLSLPDSRGFDSFSGIRAASSDIPVVILTGLEDENMAKKVMQYGAQDYILKNELSPFTINKAVFYAIDRKKNEYELKDARDKLDEWNRQLEKRIVEKTEEIKKCQEQILESAKLASIGRLTAGLAHQINSPLTGLLGLLRVYKKDVPEETQQYEDIEEMIKASEFISRIVKDLVEFSGRHKPVLELLDVDETIDTALGFIRKTLDEKGISVIKNNDGNRTRIMGNKNRLQQIMLTLIQNAQDAMPEGGKVEISIKTSEDSIEIDVSDTGTGIAPEDLDKIFDPFFSTKPQGQGVGLGLSVIYGIVKDFGGSINVKSRQGEGTVFNLIFPSA